MSTHEKLKAQWAKQASDLLVGRKIVAVRYTMPHEEEHMMWDSSAIVLQLDDGNIIYPSMDDEGNGPGALFTNDDKLPTIPVI